MTPNKKETPLYETIPSTTEQLILIEQIKFIVDSILKNKSELIESRDTISFIENTIEIVQKQLTQCECDFSGKPGGIKEGIKKLEEMHINKLAELELKVKKLEDEKEHLKTTFKKNELELNHKLRFDPLTKIFNRYEFNIQFDAIVDNYNNEGKSFTFALLDLDLFKEVNDRYGHNYGDRVLYVIGYFLNKSLKSNSSGVSVFRIGGEEFAIIADGTIEKDIIFNRLQFLLSKLNMHSIKEKNEKPEGQNKQEKKTIRHKQTFSASVKYFEGKKGNTLTCKDVFTSVDKGLYKSKKERNNIKSIK